jgi:hypothetical protein
VTNGANCTKTSAIVTVTSACRNQLSSFPGSSFKILVSPNPAINYAQVKIQFDEIHHGVVQIELLNMLSQRILTSDIDADGAELIYELPADEIEPGMYFLKVMADGKQQVTTLVINGSK